MVVFLLFSNLAGIWEKSNCQCASFDVLSIFTPYFTLSTMNISMLSTQGNQSELCINCKNTYRDLNSLYSDMEKNNTMCIDIEDAINVTRKRWSKTFNCSFHNEENVPIIAVSSFMLFLPIIFYLSTICKNAGQLSFPYMYVWA
uniref:Osteopetrosis-associated transmembrane protein 1 n=1 Tax=Neogobius melanostomus TaxID=47308 RepID=A0A8C6ULU5_9GOBI